MKNNINNNHEANLKDMDFSELEYLNKLLQEHNELKQKYNEEIYFANKSNVAFEVYGNIFPSVKKAAEHLGINRASIYYKMRTKKDFEGWFIRLNHFGEVVQRSKKPFGSKSKNKEEEHRINLRESRKGKPKKGKEILIVNNESGESEVFDSITKAYQFIVEKGFDKTKMTLHNYLKKGKFAFNEYTLEIIKE